MNLCLENIVNIKADTPDNICYRDKAEKLSCKKAHATFFKNASSRYKEGNQLNASLISETW
ncbi:hypothetical protein RHORCCE3_1831 [Rickettsia hoogstraalii str. RCCE3]|nr:hypothetical protein RHORCCE3_1831 [Rickettsia hoogstraalii str. RCCE3]